MRKIVPLLLMSWVFWFNGHLHGNFDTQKDCETIRTYVASTEAFMSFKPSACVQGSTMEINVSK